MTNTKRVPWIDDAKMFAMLFVVLGHTNGVVGHVDSTIFNMWIVSFNMALFVVLSGVTSSKWYIRTKTWNDVFNYVIKITERILLPAAMARVALSIVSSILGLSFLKLFISLSIIVIVFLIYKYKAQHINKAINFLYYLILICSIPISFFSPFWFLKMIWIILLYFAVGSKLLNAKTVYLVPLGILFILITGFGGYQYGAEFVLYYILGIYLCLWVEKKHVVITNSILAPLYLLVAVISFVLCKEYVDFYSVSITQLLNNHKIVFFILRQVCGISWSLFFICLIRRFSIRYTKL